MDKMDRNILNRHIVVRECLHLLFVVAPIVALAPVGDEFFQLGSVGAVLPFVIGEIIGPAHTGKPFAYISKRGFGNSNGERGFLHE